MVYDVRMAINIYPNPVNDHVKMSFWDSIRRFCTWEKFNYAMAQNVYPEIVVISKPPRPQANYISPVPAR